VRSAEREDSERRLALDKSRGRPSHHDRRPLPDRGREGHGRRRQRDSGGGGEDAGYYGPSSRREGAPGDRAGDNQQRGGTKAARIVDDDEPEEGRRKRRKGEGDDHDGERDGDKDSDDANKIKPDFGLSGALSKDAKTGNVYKGVLLKFREPPEARAPNTKWRLYVYKAGELVETLHISRQSAYLVGRHPDVCDVVLAHPSCSSQHAVLQYRAVPHKPTGRLQCLPYIMDLESTNGTFLSGVRIDPARYYQLKAGDVLTFGASTREYVLIAA
jgi:smad nuclear-interacting protein 1